MNLTLQLYNALVNRVPSIQRKYYRIRQDKPGRAGRVYAWSALAIMNLKWALGIRNFAREESNPDCKKTMMKKGTESGRFPKQSPIELAKQLSQADVISFDIFDTLIFRPFSAPTDLFYLAGDRLGYMDFVRIRREAEKTARQKAKQKRNTYEVTLSEIYDEVEEMTGIPKALGMDTETALELECCYGNPYMTMVLEALRGLPEMSHKKIICTTDMYLPVEILKKMLKKCGFGDIIDVVVSCEHGISKADGSLYRKVMELFGLDKSYIHVGDNMHSDIVNARKAGWRCIYYENVNQVGRKYRAEDMSVLTGSFYRGIVNAGLYCGREQYSKDFELGYTYGGLFVLGYCRFIHHYVEEQKIDKLLFLARDGEILYKVYKLLYPQECQENRAEYVYWSRTAAAKMTAGYFKEDYFRRFLHHKINQNYTIEQIFSSMQLEDMLAALCEEQPAFTKETLLTQHNEAAVRSFLNSHWETVLEHYQSEIEAGGLYYGRVLKGCKKAVTVDIGWAGSGSLTLDYMADKVWKLNCEITGLLAGTNTLNNTEPDMSEAALYTGKLTAYLYSQELNRDIWKWHNPGQNHNLLMELLLSSAEGSFAGFAMDKNTPGGYALRFKEPDVPAETVQEIQRGIQTFVEDYMRNVPAEYAAHEIAGSDCYAVLRILLQSKMDTPMDMGI